MNLSTRRLFTAILFVALFVMTAREIADPDFWWHLRTGEYIVQTGAVPHVDVFSGTVAGQPWVAHEWLSEVSIYALYSLGSYPLLIVVFSGLITLAFAFVYARCRGRPYVAAFAVLLAALASAPTWGVRPQMLSLLLSALFLWVIDKWSSESHSSAPPPDGEMTASAAAIQGSSLRSWRSLRLTSFPLLWILVPLTVLWVNLHSGFALGLAILAVRLVGEMAGVVAAKLRGAQVRAANLKVLAAVFAACVVVVPLNPNGATMYIYPFQTLTSRAMQAYIQEWFSPDFHLVEFQPFAWLLLATLAAVGFSGRRLTVTQVILLFVFGYAGLRSARNIPIFAVIAAPVLAEHLWSILEPRLCTSPLAPRPSFNRHLVNLLNLLLLLLVLLAAAVRLALVFSDQAATERADYPAAAVDFLQAHHAGGIIYNEYGWGGYLIWRMFPAAQVFIDGRADVYGDVFIGDYLNAYRGDSSWRALLDRYGVRTILVQPDAPIVSAVAGDPEWKKVYGDKIAVVWER